MEKSINSSEIPKVSLSIENWLGLKEDFPDADKKIIIKHLLLSGGINRWKTINSFLINEMHQKKCIKKRLKYKIQDALTQKYYDYYLFRGQKILTSLDSFPCQFQGILDSVMFRELSLSSRKSFDYTQIYYNHRDKPSNLQCSSFNETEWELSTDFQMSDKDIVIMNKLKIEFLSFLQQLLKIIEEGISEEDYIKKTYFKIEKAFNKI